MTRTFNATVLKEDDWYVAQCLDVDIASQGRTEAEALANLAEAIRLHLTPPSATAVPPVHTIEVELRAA